LVVWLWVRKTTTAVIVAMNRDRIKLIAGIAETIKVVTGGDVSVIIVGIADTIIEEIVIDRNRR
jgi:hypothetical protein